MRVIRVELHAHDAGQIVAAIEIKQEAVDRAERAGGLDRERHLDQAVRQALLGVGRDVDVGQAVHLEQLLHVLIEALARVDALVRERATDEHGPVLIDHAQLGQPLAILIAEGFLLADAAIERRKGREHQGARHLIKTRDGQHAAHDRRQDFLARFHCSLRS